jgi:hypothetical protein
MFVIFDLQNVFTQCLCRVCGQSHTGLRAGQSGIDYRKRQGLLDALAYSRKAPISFSYPSVRPCVRIYQLGTHSTDFRKILYWGLLWNFVGKFHVWLKLKKKKKHGGRFTWRRKCLPYCCQWLVWRMLLLESCLQTCMTYTIAECTVNKLLMMDRGTVRNM